MAMTKAEKQRMENLEAALRLARALRWPDYTMPSAMSREKIEANKVPGGEKFGCPQMIARGWFVNHYECGRVSYGCSNGVYHSREGDTISTQEMGCMYETELEAWQVLRHAKTEEYAKHLADIDAQIERLRS